MIAEVIIAAQDFIGYQVPFFLLVFGILYTALAFIFKPLAQLVGVPLGVLCITSSIAWFAVSGGSFFAMPLEIMQVLGFGIIAVVVGKVFAG